jgi:hypothetical protein
MHDIQGTHEVVPYSDDSLVNRVDKFTIVLFLASHLDVDINLLKHWEKVFSPEKSTHLAKYIQPMLKISIS